jgi:uroporphyrinogen decarboxylase
MYGGMQGFFNTPRRYVGLERLMVTFYDDPKLIKDMIGDAVDLLIAIYDPVLSDIGGDYAMISEDICYKAGCFISPAMFREFMLPAYQKMTGFYRDHGIHTILVDSDGDVTGLIPLLIEGGVTGLHPFEVTGNCDIVEVRRAFPRFQILGGIDKKKVAAGKAAIDEELERKVPFVFKGGGFVPFIDHSVPPDISWENFRYYRRRLAELAVQ